MSLSLSHWEYCPKRVSNIIDCHPFKNVRGHCIPRRLFFFVFWSFWFLSFFFSSTWILVCCLVITKLTFHILFLKNTYFKKNQLWKNNITLFSWWWVLTSEFLPCCFVFAAFFDFLHSELSINRITKQITNMSKTSFLAIVTVV